MGTAVVVALVFFATNTSPLDEQVRDAATRWGADAGVQLDILNVDAAPSSGCEVEAIEAPPHAPATGSAVFRLRAASDGPTCGFARVTLAVLEPVLVLLRDVPAGASLEGALREERRSDAPSRRVARHVPAGAVALRALQAGDVLLAADARVPGPEVGDRVDVLWRRGTLRLATHGVVIPCRRQDASDFSPAVCVRLPTGKRVEGAYQEGRVLVEAP